MSFFASVEGTATIRSQPRAFVETLVRRIETGLLPHAPPWRSRYLLTGTAGADGLGFRAADWRTALNVGLNDVHLVVFPDGSVRYTIWYWRWAGYALALGATIGAVLILVFLAIDIRSYIQQHPTSRFPGLSIDQNAAFAWAMALFWGFVFPWILILMHRWPLRRLMNQIIAEVDAAAMGSRG